MSPESWVSVLLVVNYVAVLSAFVAHVSGSGNPRVGTALCIGAVAGALAVYLRSATLLAFAGATVAVVLGYYVALAYGLSRRRF
ncbi:MAG: hypothetical protein HY711_07315 [Candidatus Melainabacteria bacterium]|nr:hypothetical protein [Candidatus Melainabacteria bacterium]